MTGQQKRGSKHLTARDWLFGSRPRRLVLRFILDHDAPEDGWTKSDIATACGLSIYGGAAAHINGLVGLGLLDEEDGRYWPLSIENSLLARVADLVDELEGVPDIPITELPTA
jgi:hypothetical protein